MYDGRSRLANRLIRASLPGAFPGVGPDAAEKKPQSAAAYPIGRVKRMSENP